MTASKSLAAMVPSLQNGDPMVQMGWVIQEEVRLGSSSINQQCSSAMNVKDDDNSR
jgi:hypothetical protein